MSQLRGVIERTGSKSQSIPFPNPAVATIALPACLSDLQIGRILEQMLFLVMVDGILNRIATVASWLHIIKCFHMFISITSIELRSNHYLFAGAQGSEGLFCRLGTE